MKKIYFVSNNVKKYEEFKQILGDEVELAFYKMRIDELQTEDVETLLRHKARTAFQELRRPLIVEHTALIINAFRNLPGLQTSYFYDKMGPRGIVDYCRSANDYKATAKSHVCFCNGKQFLMTHGSEDGEITDKYDEALEIFAWDSIFIPNAENPKRLVYARRDDKNRRSMRRQAIDALKERLDEAWEGFDSEEKDFAELVDLIKKKKVMLFVGAGISASLGFPSWKKLLNSLGEKLGFDENLFEIYGDNMLLAEYADVVLHGQLVGELRHVFGLNEEIRQKLIASPIYKAILDLDFPVIYTTNYDSLIEEYYKINKHDYNLVVNMEDLRDADSSAARIMKFHGDLNTEKQIVLSESQYFKRMDFQSFLDVQLQADLLRYHVLFLGYSLSDINMKLLLYLARKRQMEAGDNSRMQAYIFTTTPNQVQKVVFEKNGITTFSGQDADKESGTRQFLEELCQMATQ